MLDHKLVTLLLFLIWKTTAEEGSTSQQKGEAAAVDKSADAALLKGGGLAPSGISYRYTTHYLRSGILHSKLGV